MSMSNKDKQTWLDKQKFLKSAEVVNDMSGKMPYCEKCNYKNATGTCSILHEQRVTELACAKAYNALHR